MGNHFGEHITIDGYGGNKDQLDNKEIINNALIELPGLLGMKILIPPVIVSVADNGLKDPGGWTGFVIIAESHISIHTFPKRGFLSADVYTCKNGMDTGLIKTYFQNKFTLTELETNFIKRGIKYPPQNLT